MEYEYLNALSTIPKPPTLCIFLWSNPREYVDITVESKFRYLIFLNYSMTGYYVCCVRAKLCFYIFTGLIIPAPGSNKHFLFHSPLSSKLKEPMCFSFWYNTNESVQNFVINTTDLSGEKVTHVITDLRTNGNYWRRYRANLPGQSTPFKVRNHMDGLAQNCSNSIPNALELLQSYAKPSIVWWQYSEIETKWLIFCNRYFQCILWDENYYILIKNWLTISQHWFR